MDRISGAYPGGPSRERVEGDESHAPPPAIRGGEDREQRAALRMQHDKLRSRRTRLVVGVGVTLLLSAAAGTYWGLSAIKTSDELAEVERERLNQSQADIVGRELDRLVDELWKMEDLERAPRR